MGAHFIIPLPLSLYAYPFIGNNNLLDESMHWHLQLCIELTTTITTCETMADFNNITTSCKAESHLPTRAEFLATGLVPTTVEDDFECSISLEKPGKEIDDREGDMLDAIFIPRYLQAAIRRELNVARLDWRQNPFTAPEVTPTPMSQDLKTLLAYIAQCAADDKREQEFRERIQAQSEARQLALWRERHPRAARLTQMPDQCNVM